jgi:fructose/tagatose bisphosphate aldolase
MHGMLESMVQGKTKKHLNIERIAQIKKAAGVFLTLHGGSGTDDEDFVRAIAAGINTIHINTELRVAWRRSLEGSLSSQPNEVVPYKNSAASRRFRKAGREFPPETVQCSSGVRRKTFISWVMSVSLTNFWDGERDRGSNNQG